MAYYWVTEAQKYIQCLGFGSTRRAVNKESQDIRINQYGIDNSFSWDKHDVLRFGKGGVDDAEDAEVILHEYGHAMMDSQVDAVRVRHSAEAGAIGEGFGDYWAVTVSTSSPRRPTRLRRRLGFGLVHVQPCRTACDGWIPTSLPGGPGRRGPSRRPDLVARPMGHPPGARARARRHDDPRSAVLVRRRHDDAGGGHSDSCHRAEPLRRRCRGDRPCRIRGSRDPLEPITWAAAPIAVAHASLPGDGPFRGTSAIVGA